MKQQKGFTLVEMAIVLVIIGLLLGGVLKGQELIKNSKIKALANDAAGISAAMNGYQDRYRALPGDDPRAATQVQTGLTNGNGDGVIEGAMAAATGVLTGESLQFFNHLQAAKFFSAAPGGVAGTFLSSYGSPFGISTNAFASGNNVLNVCFLNIPGDVVRSFELANDDGNATTGRVRAAAALDTVASAVGALTVATDANTYTMCIAIN